MSKIKPKNFFITLLRHGESIGNAESRWQGQKDYPLTERGRAQAQALAARWKQEKVKFDAVIASPLSRAKETAEIIASSLDLRVEFDPLWMERDNGKFSGLTGHEVKHNFVHPEFHNPYDPVGVDGESNWELFLRAGQVLNNLLKREPAKYLIVSHGGLLNLVMYTIVGITPQANHAGLRFRFSNTAFAKLIYYPHQHCWMIDALNDHVHAQDAESEE